ncbi:23S rRNA (guanosine(2251)-2'-O)-methyltransferase RlmB [Inmirania thermothiophila]|uniref:23S rRNA Gm-2251 2'-O-methyltransferase n=1 Tax=Inmirania thermothiophila TaxID=1750597 RepID=A0A3N1Y0K3_9GAMM|nr:23S rRNA (guanosine(2251)-2'-O)-methyltransferase RlmB [Inmirania thermothiophila]ROR32038.1 23S rRNA Gm-2251 2'-O-methyltransferase [Inmirania thermothiophila]
MSPGRWICGVHAVLAALESPRAAVEAVELAAPRRDRRAARVRAAAARRRIPVREVPRAELDARFPGLPHQGVAARCAGLAELDEAALPGLVTAEALLLVLDGVQDPRNLGAALRSAAAFGAAAVVVPRDRAAGLTPAAEKAAAGAAERLPLVRVTNLARALDRLAEAGVHLVGAEADAPTALAEAELPRPLAFILGGEARGLRRLTRERCHSRVAIPMAEGVESLNVSVAAAVCLYEARRRG